MPKLLSSIKRFIGDSTESKATDCPNGSTFLETDTGDMYIFRKEIAGTGDPGDWHLKEEANIALRLDIKLLLSELLIETKKTNEFLESMADTLAE